MWGEGREQDVFFKIRDDSDRSTGNRAYYPAILMLTEQYRAAELGARCTPPTGTTSTPAGVPSATHLVRVVRTFHPKRIRTRVHGVSHRGPKGVADAARGHTGMLLGSGTPGRRSRTRESSSTLNHKRYTLHNLTSQPSSSLYLQPSILNPQLSSLSLQPSILTQFLCPHYSKTISYKGLDRKASTINS
jgi:hypothetical protein